MSPYLRELRAHLPHLHQSPQEPRPAPGRRDGELPVPGYDQLGERDLVHELHHYSQAELAAIEEYELAHEHRSMVLNKLHYLRGPQPWQLYDEMASDEICARLENADLPTLKDVRDYEHKFRNRPAVVDAAMELIHERQAFLPPRSRAAGSAPGGLARER